VLSDAVIQPTRETSLPALLTLLLGNSGDRKQTRYKYEVWYNMPVSYKYMIDLRPFRVLER